MDSQDSLVGRLPVLEPPRAKPTADGRMHAIGLGMTVAVHAGVLAAMILVGHFGHDESKQAEKPFQSIEAGLAIKKKATSAPKSKLPQKDQPPPVKPPDAPKIATNPNQVPQPKKEEKKPPPPDAESVFDKYRKMDTRAHEEIEVEGSDDGSEFGTLERAKGDPYVGELIGRMTTEFVVPSVVSDHELKTWGCVKLDTDGKITDRAIDPEHKSKSHAFNSAVEARLKRTTDMEQPVPNYLKEMLVGKFVCATYTSNIE